MRIRLLKSKIHRATVTDRNLDYTGSIQIDQDLMDAAGIVPYEQVLVADVNNGSRHETYAVAGPRGSGTVSVMGAAARLVDLHDKVIIMAFGDFEPQEAAQHKPRVVVVDAHNRKVSTGGAS
jgi:aspartate 1-decarboxylase